MAALFIVACASGPTEGDQVVARAYDSYLYMSDIEKVLPMDISPEDSSNLATTFINNWLKERAELAQAELNLSEQQKDFDNKLENYYNNLVLYAYENELVRQKLNTKVSEEELHEHYINNQKEFELRQSIVKARYLAATDLEEKERKIVERSFFSDNEDALSEIRVICEQQGAEFFDGSDQWLALEELLKQLQVEHDGSIDGLLSTEKHQINAGERLFFVHFVDHKLKGTLSPLSLERQRIKDMIIRKRKIELIEKMQKDVLDQAIRKGDVEVYE